MSIQDLILFSPLILLTAATWQHMAVSRLANATMQRYMQEQSLILLDQSVILQRLMPVKSSRSLFAIERMYGFEFSTHGDTRYPGSISFVGHRLKSIELAPYRPVH